MKETISNFSDEITSSLNRITIRHLTRLSSLTSYYISYIFLQRVNSQVITEFTLVLVSGFPDVVS